MKIFEASTFEKNVLADFGQDQDGMNWYLTSRLPLEWDLEKVGEDIAAILRDHYALDEGEDFRCYSAHGFDTALRDGFPICTLGDNLMVCTYLIRASRMMILDFGDAEDDCELIAKELSRKFAYLEHQNQLELQYEG